MARKDRGARDQAGVGPHRRDGIRLAPLKKLDWDVGDGEPDIRGWEVKTLGGHEIGKVNDLLVDTDAGEVVMLDIDLADSKEHTIAPIRAAQIDRSARVVRIDSSDIEPGAIPALRRDAASDDDARRFTEGYGRAYGTRGWDRDRDYIVERDGDELVFRRNRDDDAEVARATERDADIPRSPARDERRSVRYGRTRDSEEEVIERRPVVVEEVVVRRRVVDDDEARASSREFEDRERRPSEREHGGGRDVL